MWLKVRRFVKKRSLIFTLIGSSFLFSGVTAHAEEVTESFTLDPMVITATRTEMSVKERKPLGCRNCQQQKIGRNTGENVA